MSSRPSMLPQPVLFAAGYAVMALVWVKHIARGYIKPSGIPAGDAEKQDEHAAGIVAEYTVYLERYCGTAWEGQEVIELGPGGTLATGAYMLLKGAKSYCAVDAFPLAASIDQDFYRTIVGERPDLRRAIEVKDRPPFRYIVDRKFRIDEAVGDQRFDRIVSCAAFEHFDDPADTIARMTKLARPGAAACLRIDMSTHSGVLRERDPNNIYRYPDWIYWSLPFPGKPNRLRAKDYVRMLEENGWADIEVVAARVTEEDYVRRSTLSRMFQGADSQMHILSAVILARLP